MPSRRSIIPYPLVLMALLWLSQPLFLHADPKLALEKYVKAHDDSFSWKIEWHREDLKADTYKVQLISQHWQKIKWNHTLLLVIPKKIYVKPTNAILIVAGSSKKDLDQENKQFKHGKEVAERVAAPVALLFDVPRQPLFGGLTEDDLLAETFDRYLKSKDQNWPIIFPMVKSVVRAMDAMQELLIQERKHSIKGFLITGASKRGWTTWLTPVVDSRVIAIAPMVYDNLNVTRQMKHQVDSWGDYSRRISSYTDKNIPQRLKKGDPDVVRLSKMVDPFTYIDEIKIPKLIINGTNDRFWVIDAYEHYRHRIKGQTHLHYLPNARHGLRKGRDDVINTVVSFFKSLDGRIHFPRFEASIREEAGAIRAHVAPPKSSNPWEVALIVAESKKRDFRESKFKEYYMGPKRGQYRYRYPIKKKTYVAVYCQILFFQDGEEFNLSSPIHIFGPGPKKSEATREVK